MRSSASNALTIDPRPAIGVATIVALLVLGGLAARRGSARETAAQNPTTAEWPAYGGDALGSRWSALRDINRENVANLTVAWTYSTGETKPEFATRRSKVSLETTPIVVDGTMYISTPLGRVIALEPETGRERWVFDPKLDRSHTFGDFTNRGVSTWLDPQAAAGSPCRRRIFIATIDAHLFALDSRSGRACDGFGTRGVVDLRTRLRNAPFEVEEYEVTSPPAVINGLVITGSAVADNSRTDAASGEVRAFDARTGALRWTWDPVPQDSTDPAWRTWAGPRAHGTGAANAWSVIAADAERDLVFVPTGSASPDYFGGERLGDNRYANSIVALRASTGKVVWHFQAVHHDLWDYDVASPPALVTLTRNGQRIPVVLQAVKTSQLFVLHRDTGEPVFPVAERPVPASDVPGEQASPTQPFNTIIPPLSPNRLVADSAWGPTPAEREACRVRITGLRNEGQFTPPSERGTLALPSTIGGAHWGGVAFDPVRQIAVVPVNTIGIEVQLIRREGADRAKLQAEHPESEITNMRGTPWIMRREFIRGPSGLPCTPPPFGALVAIDLNTGQKKWSVPLGSIDVLAPGKLPLDVAARYGVPNLGGGIVTAGGLVFIGATFDPAIRAFDTETGRELWRATLPAGAKATPMTFKTTPNGRQFVVIAAGGDGDRFGRSDRFVAFALPATRGGGRP
jgi:quinoprotein glucose dehydrogenase